MEFGDAGEEGRNWDLLPIQWHASGLRTGELQQVVDEAFHPQGVRVGHCEEGRVERGAFPHSVLDRLEVPPDVRQRCAQLVGGVRHESRF